MSHRVPEVQDRAPSRLPLVRGYHRGFDFDGAGDHPLQGAWVLAYHRLVLVLEETEVVRVRDHAVLDGFRQSRRELDGRERCQGVEVGDHAPRLVEGSQQVLSGRHIDPRLPADRGVDHREQRGRDLHVGDAAADQDVVGRVVVCRDWNVDLHHCSSGTPAATFTARASTNSRSDSRFRYCTTAGLIASSCDSATTARSARRHTVRARCSAAALGVPPGRMKFLRGASFASCVSIASSSVATFDAPTGAPLEASALRSLPGSGVASSAPMVKRSRWMACSSPSPNPGGSSARASPMAALSSSTCPYASTRRWSFGTRPPPNSPVSPASPVLV